MLETILNVILFACSVYSPNCPKYYPTETSLDLRSSGMLFSARLVVS